MRIQLTDNYFLEQTSEVELTLYKKHINKNRKGKNRIQFKAIGYYSDINSGLKALINAKLFDKKETVTLQQFLKEFEKIKNDLNKQLGL